MSGVIVDSFHTNHGAVAITSRILICFSSKLGSRILLHVVGQALPALAGGHDAAHPGGCGAYHGPCPLLVRGVDLEQIAVGLQSEGDRRLAVLGAELLGDLGGVVTGHSLPPRRLLLSERGDARECDGTESESGESRAECAGHDDLLSALGSPLLTVLPKRETSNT
jgi:hypothetical protein